MKFFITIITFFLKSLVTGILYPIDLLVSANIPWFADALAYVGNLLSWAINFCNWALSWIPINGQMFAIIISIWVFKLTIPVVAESVKLVVRWWHALAP